MNTPFKLLFVCMGNICRSPAAHGIMQKLVDRSGRQEHVVIDSAGTGGWHAGTMPDARMQHHASKRGYQLDHIARQVQPQDFEHFDLILVMDRQNLREIRAFCPNEALMSKVRLFCEFARDRAEKHVPDPYYGGEQGFEQVLDIVENGCGYLLDHVITATRVGVSGN